MKLRTILMTSFLISIISCTTQVEKLVNSVKSNDIETAEKILSNNSVKIECNSQVLDLFSFAIQSKNEKMVQVLINSDLFDCIKNNKEIISEILSSSFNYDVKIGMIKKGINISLDIIDDGEQVPVYYWMAQNALSKDLVLFADKISDYSIAVKGTSLVDLLVLRHHEYIDRYHIDQRSLDIKDSKGDTPLALAIKKGMLNVALSFIEKGAALSDISSDNTWFLVTRNWKDGYIDIANALINNGLLLSKDHNGIEAFKGVLFSRQLDFDGQIEIIKWLVSNGFNADQVDPDGKSAEDYLWDTSPSIDEPNASETMKKKEFQKTVLGLLGDNVYSF